MTCRCGDHENQTAHFAEEFEEIARLLVINKIRYYEPEKGDRVCPVPDELYDSFEKRYLQLCDLLGLSNTLVHKAYGKIGDWEVPEHLDGTGMMEIDWADPTVRMVCADMANWPGGSKKVKRKK